MTTSSARMELLDPAPRIRCEDAVVPEGRQDRLVAHATRRDGASIRRAEGAPLRGGSTSGAHGPAQLGWSRSTNPRSRSRARSSIAHGAHQRRSPLLLVASGDLTPEFTCSARDGQARGACTTEMLAKRET